MKKTNKVIATSICMITSMMVLGSVQVQAANTNMPASYISAKEAETAAITNAGVKSTDVQFLHTEFDFEHRQYVYEVDFVVGDTEYDYTIKAEDGRVLKKETELTHKNKKSVSQNGVSQNSISQNSVDQTKTQKNDRTKKEKQPANNAAYIGIDKAKEIAVAHAQKTISSVVFSKAKLENDDRQTEYEIEFYADDTEYEYNIDALTGNILEYDSEWMD